MQTTYFFVKGHETLATSEVPRVDRWSPFLFGFSLIQTLWLCDILVCNNKHFRGQKSPFFFLIFLLLLLSHCLR